MGDTGHRALKIKAQPVTLFGWRPWAIVLTLVCVAPLILLAAGINLSTAGHAPLHGLSEMNFVDAAHHTLRGSFSHTILEWTAVCVASFVALLAFVHYRLKGEPSVPIIGVALVCAGGMDAFHTFAADRLIEVVADNRDLIPFTWALCRLFNATILLVGVFLVLSRPTVKEKHSGRFIALVSVSFVVAAYYIIATCAASDSLPQTMFADSTVKRPYDLYPLLPYALCAVVAFPRYYKRYPSVFAQTLLLGLIPAFATQCYMAFGSYALHDSCFNIAHAAKALSYTVPLLGLLVDYSQTYRLQQVAEKELLASVSKTRQQHSELAMMQALAEQSNMELSEQAEALGKARRASVNIMKDALIARQQADAANVAKSEFLANMSHEIRTPMTAILGFAETISENVSSPENIDAIATVRRNGEYLLKVINDILDLSKVEAGKMVMERIHHNPCQTVAEVAMLMKERATGEGIGFNIEYVGEIPETIHSDPTRLRQILINLIGNAIKFTHRGDVRLVVRCVEYKGNPVIQFDVVDTGIGMTEAQVANLFQPFRQADNTTTRRFGGTGLGLTISKRFAEMLGGEIAVVDTQAGVGTRFRLTVPTGCLDGVKMTRAQQLEMPASDATSAMTSSTEPDLQGCRILLAEDGADNQRLIALVLRKSGAEVTVIENGELALESALAARDEGTPFDAILMDMQMPVMDGYEATRSLRREGYEGPIIALTAHAMEGDRKKCVDAGCDEYATKPIHRKQLIATIARFVNGDESKAEKVTAG